MYPILFAIGPIRIFSFGVFLVLSWCVWSFLFWRHMRGEGVDEDRIFSLMFTATIAAFVASRIGFVLTHWGLFAPNALKIVALWVQPGLSLVGGALGAFFSLWFVSQKQGVRMGYVFDGMALSLPWALALGKIGSFLDEGHPVALYEWGTLFLLGILLFVISEKARKRKKPYGTVGIWFFLLYAPAAFVLEFFKDAGIYWGQLSANQWVFLVLFAEACGAFYVVGGGRELYAKLSKRHS